MELFGYGILTIDQSRCFSESVYLCARYRSIGPYDPPIRDLNEVNDFMCVNTDAMMNCQKG